MYFTKIRAHEFRNNPKMCFILFRRENFLFLFLEEKITYFFKDKSPSEKKSLNFLFFCFEKKISKIKSNFYFYLIKNILILIFSFSFNK
jgi:hypothetical protein